MAFTRPAVCVITNRHRLAPDARTPADAIAVLVEFLDLAAAVDVDLIHVREPDLDAATLTEIVRHLVSRVRQAGTGARVIVNSRTDVALAAGANGVHLRADDPATSRVRSLLTAGLVGRSVHVGEAADVVARAEGADYLCFGPVFPSRSKPDAEPAGLPALVAAIAAAAAPVLAIGGVTPSRAMECRRAGAAGVAGIDIFLPEGRAPGSLGVGRAVQELRQAMMSAF